MDVREKLVEMSEQLRYCANVSDCANCKRWDKVCGNKCVDSLLLMAADMIDEVSSVVTVHEWIPVEERLPEKQTKCLVYTKRGEYGGYEITYYNEGFYLQYSNVTNWMPLPNPPKGE